MTKKPRVLFIGRVIDGCKGVKAQPLSSGGAKIYAVLRAFGDLEGMQALLKCS